MIYYFRDLIKYPSFDFLCLRLYFLFPLDLFFLLFGLRVEPTQIPAGNKLEDLLFFAPSLKLNPIAIKSGKLDLIHVLLASMITQPDQEMLHTALSAAVRLHNMDLPKEILELRVEEPVLGAFEDLRYEVTAFLQQLCRDVQSGYQELRLDVLIHIVKARDVWGSIADYELAFLTWISENGPLNAFRIRSRVSCLVISPVI